MATPAHDHSQDVDLNDQTISQYLSSLTDLDTFTDVIDLNLDASVSPLTQWSLRDVKARFEAAPSEPPQAPIICPCLPFEGVPEIASRLNLGRNNNSELIRLMRNVPNFMCRTVLAQRGAVQPHQTMDFDMWITVEQGLVWVIEEPQTGEQQELVEGENPHRPIALLRGDTMILPKRNVHFIFQEDTMLTIGNIVPSRTPN
ncbi:hypothetical protein DL95DRAFT_416406 [Leptodontidium sp. 2 PMI_412]|nr:hypothetical protein BKA61DRAFT_710304 [Leptodontidium sp. MPI-SDFR-AT-0119]KAH9206581.1 hypothetical protein DL95DRAFT_416406 [Leptodontidium sp. 2 PMI_412]